MDSRAEILDVVPFVFFRLVAASDALHMPDCVSTGLRGLMLSIERHGPLSASALADMRPVSRQAVHKASGELIARGWVRRAQPQGRGNAANLELTAAGRAQIRAMRSSEMAGIKRLFRGVDSKDIEAALRVLTVVNERLAPAAWQRRGAGEQASAAQR